jgi:hypothetical protein
MLHQAFLNVSVFFFSDGERFVMGTNFVVEGGNLRGGVVVLCHSFTSLVVVAHFRLHSKYSLLSAVRQWFFRIFM